ncbi:hypothetical protein [Massiliimalia timonensis]|uniref:hypothetical protein n=1 Tax=Massiliimalia timonensis TaxID=1987501 RepID=UPI0018A0C753|nr:hypothetical protein [Massiliimalia timonensis]
MKKRKSTVLSVLIGLPIILLALYYIVPIFISMGFYQEGVRYKNIDVYEGLFDCFAGTYYWDREGMTVTIPDKYHGKPITALGGYFGPGVPTLFFVSPSLPEEKGLTLFIGKNISEINEIEWEDFVWVECSPENKTFYAEDGVLYARKDDSVVFDPDDIEHD